jgi:hypothetical protein
MGRRRSSRIGPSTISLLGWAALVAALIAGSALGSGDRGAPHLSALVSGGLSISDSRGQGAIVSMGDIYPGGGTEGDVTIGNTGSVAGTLALDAADPLSGTPTSAVLGQELQLTITDVTSGSPTSVLSGPYAAMPSFDLGTLQPGDQRSYRFAVAMPDGGAPPDDWSGDNVYQHLATALDFNWTLTETGVTGGGGSGGTGGGGTGGGGTGGGDGAPAPVSPLAPAGCVDRLQGDGAANLLVGGTGGDSIFGGAGPDVIRAGLGNDCLYGQRGNDRIFGGGGNDFLSGGRGRDALHGGPGGDVISAVGAGRDWIECGTGSDWVIHDARDRVRGC